MALKQIMLSNKINKKRTELAALIEKDSEFSVREAELETSIGEASTEEEQAVVEAAIDQFEADKAKHEEDKAKLQTDSSGQQRVQYSKLLVAKNRNGKTGTIYVGYIGDITSFETVAQDKSLFIEPSRDQMNKKKN